MKQDKHELTHKKFIKAKKRLEKIYEEERNIPWRKLDKPYQDGWKLSIVLRDDYLRSDAGLIVKILLEKFARKGYTKNPKFITQIRKKPVLSDVRRLLYKKYIYQSPLLCVRDIFIKEFEQLSAQQKKYFTQIPLWQKHLSTPNRYDYELNIPSHYLLVKIDKYMISYIKDINPLLVKEKAELKKILVPYWRTQSYGEGYYHYFERRKERRKSKLELSKIKIEPEEV